MINTPCVIAGGDWVPFDSGAVRKEGFKVDAQQSEPIEDPKTQPVELTQVKQEPVQEPEENTGDFDGITIAQIKQELDAFGVEYNPKDKKQVLYDLMMQHGK